MILSGHKKGAAAHRFLCDSMQHHWGGVKTSRPRVMRTKICLRARARSRPADILRALWAARPRRNRAAAAYGRRRQAASGAIRASIPMRLRASRKTLWSFLSQTTARSAADWASCRCVGCRHRRWLARRMGLQGVRGRGCFANHSYQNANPN